MAYKYSYPVVDRALRNFLVFVLVLMVVIGIGATLGTSSEIIDLPMLFDALDDSIVAASAHPVLAIDVW